MRTSKYILRTSLMACFVSCCISFASADNPPFFTTDIKLNDKGEMLLRCVEETDLFLLCLWRCPSSDIKGRWQGDECLDAVLER